MPETAVDSSDKLLIRQPERLNDCSICSRLADFRNQVKTEHPDYYCQPVPAFGDPDAALIIVGLAPGLHGANATGRPFTGDFAGILLYETLYRYGYSNQPKSVSRDDGLKLRNCLITNAVKCLPPQNKPTTQEIKNCCHTYLSSEISLFPGLKVMLALGTIAHNSVLLALGEKRSAYKFGHNVTHRLSNGLILVDSYHCSRYNTQTRRLTENMFHSAFDTISKLL